MSVTTTTSQITYAYVKSKTKDELWTLIELLLKNQEWRPIETAPKDCTTVLVTRMGDLYPVTAFRVDDDVWLRECEGPEDSYEHLEGIKHTQLAYAPTHWMPMPEVPK